MNFFTKTDEVQIIVAFQQINHQTETISQLRKEAQQWKDQFMRVDEERLRLSSRNDELMSHQLHVSFEIDTIP